ncbi:MAG: Tol-Pal system beta propeller repeat protein TolB [Gammaproteobacteria bacterium]
MSLPVILLALLSCLPWAPAAAELRIQITRGVSEAVPIAVVPFGWSGGQALPLDVAAVVAGDLASSGRFAPMDRRDMVSMPSVPDDLVPADWRLLNVDVVVIGQVVPAGPGKVEIRFHVFDVYRGQALMDYSLEAPVNNLRAAAHRIADMIFERLTGVPGVFSTRIAYVSVDRSGDQEVYRLVVADADGASPTVIAESPEPIMSPAWSPDGRRMAYVSFESGNSAVYVQELATGRRKPVSEAPGINGAPAWSPDGRRLAMTLSGVDGNLDVFVVNADGSGRQRVTTNPAIDTEAAWAPDGRSLFFTSDRAGGPQIYQRNLAGGPPRRVTFEGVYNARPRVSPDGKTLAVVHNDRGNYRIAAVDLDRGTVRVLSDGRQDESPSFAPNGSLIIYATRDRGEAVLAAVSVDGRVQQRIASTEGDVREPVWSPYRE